MRSDTSRLSESHNPAPHSSYPWDYVHLNSVDPGPSGEDVLLSARNTWTLYDVDIHSGGFRWRLGGIGTRTSSSARARASTGSTTPSSSPAVMISVFDNGSTPAEGEAVARPAAGAQSRQPHRDPRQAVREPDENAARLQPGQSLESVGRRSTAGNWLMGYGGLPNFTEYDTSGQVVLDGTLGKNVQNFRTYLSPWSATPASTPSLAVQSPCRWLH